MRSCGQTQWFSVRYDRYQAGTAHAALGMFVLCIKKWRAIRTLCLKGLAECHSSKVKFSLQCFYTRCDCPAGITSGWADLIHSILLQGSQGLLKLGFFSLPVVAQLSLVRIEMLCPNKNLGAWHREAWISHSLQEIQPDGLTVHFGKSSDAVSRNTAEKGSCTSQFCKLWSQCHYLHRAEVHTGQQQAGPGCAKQEYHTHKKQFGADT